MVLESAVNPQAPKPALLAADTLKWCAVSDRPPREFAGPKLEATKIKGGALNIFSPIKRT